MSQFDWSVIGRALPFVAEGLLLSALLVVVATVGGLLVGALLVAMRRSGVGAFSGFAIGYVTLMRTVPLILVLFWFYFLMPLATGRPVGSLTSALIAFVLFEGAFYSEIIRAGLDSVPHGQRRAALATGLRPRTALRLVVLPQALRAMVPLILNQIIIVFQDTSLVYVVSLADFMTSASIVAQRDGRPVEIYLFVAAVYLALCFAASLLVNLSERRPAR